MQGLVVCGPCPAAGLAVRGISSQGCRDTHHLRHKPSKVHPHAEHKEHGHHEPQSVPEWVLVELITTHVLQNTMFGEAPKHMHIT